jgi:hypothetical protein
MEVTPPVGVVTLIVFVALEALKVASPEYTATIGTKVANSTLYRGMEMVALPAARVAAPSGRVSKLKLTVPVGVPVPVAGVTAAVN